MRYLALLAAAVLTAGPLALATAPPALAIEVDIELVLAVDVSSSMDLDEQVMQRNGYVTAFRHPEIIAAIKSGPYGRIAVTYVEWAGFFHHEVVVPWRILTSRGDAEAFAADLEAAPITSENRTSISAALYFAARMFDVSPVTGLRRAVDVSGDGANNSGASLETARDKLVDRGVTINGLPIILRPTNFGIHELDVYYQNCVIGGPGAFMITVEEMERFEVSIRRKLVIEIAGLPPHLMFASQHVKPGRGFPGSERARRPRWIGCSRAR